MLLNCSVGEDSWESLGLWGDPTSPSQRKSVLNIHWKDWSWSWNSNTLVIWWEELTHWKNLWCWARLKTGGEGDARGWNGYVASIDMNLSKLQELGINKEAWRASIHGVTKSWTWLSDWTELNEHFQWQPLYIYIWKDYLHLVLIIIVKIILVNTFYKVDNNIRFNKKQRHHFANKYLYCQSYGFFQYPCMGVRVRT